MLEFPTGVVESEMKIASLQLNAGALQPPPPQPSHQQAFNQKRSKKEAKMIQQKMEHLARINIHLQGKNNLQFRTLIHIKL